MKERRYFVGRIQLEEGNKKQKKKDNKEKDTYERNKGKIKEGRSSRRERVTIISISSVLSVRSDFSRTLREKKKKGIKLERRRSTER